MIQTEEEYIGESEYVNFTIENNEVGTETKEVPKAAKYISMSCYFTGIFAIVGALFCWGKGPIYTAPVNADLPLYISELLVCGPCSLIAGYGYKKMKLWGLFMGLIAVGIYIYGSVMVYSTLLLAGPPFPLELIIPPIFGIGLSIGIFKWSFENISLFE